MIKKKIIFFGSICLVILAVFLLMRKKDSPIGPTNDNIRDLGRYLFFDNRLSFNNTKSCGSCHDPAMAFTDGYRRSVTAAGENLKHNSPSLVNAALLHYFDWANPSITTLEKQHRRPLFSKDPVELGANMDEKNILQRLRSDSLYQVLFAAAFPGEKDPFDFRHIVPAIASFVRSISSFQSPYDRFMKGDSTAFSISAKEGRQLFFSKQLNCASCHPPPMFTTTSQTMNTDSIYFNTGLYNLMNKNGYPETDNGLRAVTGKNSDNGRFKTPSLRNLAFTAPYMHDGSVNTLDEVITIYTEGGRNIPAGPFAGDGRQNRNKDKRLTGFSLSVNERKNLAAFLFSLTDSSVLVNPAFQNPFNILCIIKRSYTPGRRGGGKKTSVHSKS